MAGRKDATTDEEVLQVFVESENDFLKSRTLQESLGYSTRPGTIKRLKKLAEKGYLDFQNSSGYIWWITDEGLAHLDQLED